MHIRTACKCGKKIHVATMHLAQKKKRIAAQKVGHPHTYIYFSPNENLALGTSVFREFFSNFTEVLIILKMSKKRSNYESSVFLRICGGEKKDLFWFLAIFDKNTGHKVTKF